MPVGYDRDGAVSNLYRVGGCPTLVYAYPGGILERAEHRRADGRTSVARRSRTCSRRRAARGGGPTELDVAGREEPLAERGWVAPAVARGVPGLCLAHAVEAALGPQPGAGASERLRALSDRFTAAHAIHMRERPIPWAYRVFFRQIGLDPDQDPHADRGSWPWSG